MMRKERRRRSLGAVAATILGLVLAACSEPEEGAPEAWTEGLTAGLDAMEERAGAGDFEGALGVAARLLEPDAFARLRRDLDRWSGGVLERSLGPVTALLDWLGVDALTSDDRGEVEFARATVELAAAALAEGDDREAARRAAEEALARARAASPATRADAVCVLGAVDLERGEEVRATLPEVSGQPAPAPAPGGNRGQKLGGAADGEDQGPDPLEVARGHYEDARAHFVEALGLLGGAPAGPDDARRALVLETTRADVELCIRRLRELDRIEQEREDQQQDEDQQDPQDQPQSGDGEPQGEPQEQEPPDTPPEDQQQPGEDQEAPPEPQDDTTDQEGEPEEQEPDAEPEIQEREMTKEELERFLEQARENQEEGEERRRVLLQKRKVPTQRDW